MSLWNRRQRMGSAALLMGGSVLLSRFMGLARDKVISYYFGATRESDIYFAAFVIPDFINYLLAGAYFSITLIPILAERFREDEEDGWRFFSAAVTWVGLAVSILTVAAFILAPELARLAAPGLDAEGHARLARFLRIIVPAQAAFLTGACFTAILYLRKQFFIPAVSPLVYNLVIISAGIWMRRRGMEGFCWGVLWGAFLGNFLLPVLAVRQGAGMTFIPRFRHPQLKRFFLLALPLMLGQSIVVLDEQLIRIFGSLAGTGAVSWLNYARRIMLVPVGVVAQAAGVASYPFLAELFARKDTVGFFNTLNTALRNTLVVLVPLTVWMMIVAHPTVTLIFQQGSFTAHDAARTAAVLQIFLAVVFCWGFQQILGRGFYAMQDTVTPVVVGTLATLAAVPFYFFGSRWFQAHGVAVASAASLGLYTLALALWWRHRFGSAVFKGLGTMLIKILAVSAAASLPALLPIRIASSLQDAHPYAASFGAIAGSGLLFGMAFLAAGRRFLPEMVAPLWERFVKRR